MCVFVLYLLHGYSRLQKSYFDKLDVSEVNECEMLTTTEALPQQRLVYIL